MIGENQSHSFHFCLMGSEFDICVSKALIFHISSPCYEGDLQIYMKSIIRDSNGVALYLPASDFLKSTKNYASVPFSLSKL